VSNAGLLDHHAVWACKNTAMIRRNLLALLSGLVRYQSFRYVVAVYATSMVFYTLV
jgi:hypothetical protein